MEVLINPKLVQFSDGQFGIRSGFSLFKKEDHYKWLDLRPISEPYLWSSSYKHEKSCRGTIIQARAALRRYKRAYKIYINKNKRGYKVLGRVKDDE